MPPRAATMAAWRQELDGVSETLLGVEKDRFAVEQFAPPPGLVESSRRAMDLSETPTRLVVGPAVFPIA